MKGRFGRDDPRAGAARVAAQRPLEAWRAMEADRVTSIRSFVHHPTRNREADRMVPRVTYDGVGATVGGGVFVPPERRPTARRTSAETTLLAELRRLRVLSRCDLDPNEGLPRA